MSYHQNLLQPVGYRTAMSTAPNHNSPVLVKKSCTGKKHPPGPSSAGRLHNRQPSKTSPTKSKHHLPVKSIGKTLGSKPVKGNVCSSHKSEKLRPVKNNEKPAPKKMIGGPKPVVEPKTARGQESQRKIQGVAVNTKQVKRSLAGACRGGKTNNVEVNARPSTKKLHSKIDFHSRSGHKASNVSLKSCKHPRRKTSTGVSHIAYTPKAKKNTNGLPKPGAKPKSSIPPEVHAVPSPETAFLEFIQYLAADANTGDVSSEVLRYQALQLSEQYNKNVTREGRLSVVSMAMKLEVALKYLEAEVEDEEPMRQEVMLQTGESLLAVAKMHSGKMVADTFTQQCFRIMAQRLGVCTLMRFCACAHKSDYRASSIFAQAVDVACSTARELQVLQHDGQACPTPREQAVLTLLESLVRDGRRIAPVKETIFIARRAMYMLLARSFSLLRSQASTTKTSRPKVHYGLAGSRADPAFTTEADVRAHLLEEEAMEAIKVQKELLDNRRGMSKLSAAMKLLAAIRHLEAALEEMKATSANALLTTRKALSEVSEMLSRKVAADDFTQKCFRILAQRLATCAFTRYYLHAKKLNKITAAWIKKHEINMASMASEEMQAALHSTHCLSPSEFDILSSVQSLVKGTGRFAPMEDTLSIARGAIRKLMAYQ